MKIMKPFSLFAITCLTVGLVSASQGWAQENNAAIPNRPEKLQFPPLKYEPPKPDTFRVQLKNGPIAYVVSDRDLPLVNIALYFHTGEYVVPEGLEGVQELTGALLARGGTKSKTAEELEERLAFLAADLGSDINETSGTLSINLLSKDLEEGLGILREVMTEPRFQDDKIALYKDRFLQAMRQRNDESADIEARERNILAFGEKFFVNRFTTADSLSKTTKPDLEHFHQAWFYPSNCVVAVNGDFDRETMIQQLETLFAKWPFAGKVPPAVPTNTQFATPGVYIVDKEVNQGRVSMLLPGIKRDDPDYFAASLMNDILGGGGFTSHIMNRVRSDEGLAYSAGSSFPGGVYYPLTFSASFQSKSRTVPYASSIVLEEIKNMTVQPPREDELQTSQASFINSLPRYFATKGKVANQFAMDEFTGRYAKEPMFWQQYRSRVEAVKLPDVQRVAKKYLTQDKLVILVVGQKSEILKGHPNHPEARLEELVPTKKIVDVPLRDPLTMKPITK